MIIRSPPLQEPGGLAAGEGRAPQRCRCRVPTNTTLPAGATCAEAEAAMAAAGLRYPVVAKPLWADGREGSHALAGERESLGVCWMGVRVCVVLGERRASECM